MPDLNEPKDSNMSLVYVIVALVIIVLSFLLTRRFKKATKVVLLVGLSDSGKTAIFSKLIFNKPKKSVTSLKENEATLNDFDMKLVDLPGAERLRPRYWERYREKARHVIFVVDSTTVGSKLGDLSEYLYALLSDPIVQKNRIGFTISCHKQDLDGAQDRDTIKLTIEKELTAIKETRKGQLGRTSEEENEDHLASMFADKISLDTLRVDFIETSVNNLDQLIKLIL